MLDSILDDTELLLFDVGIVELMRHGRLCFLERWENDQESQETWQASRETVWRTARGVAKKG